ncbi:MAG: hypothetical protein ING66_02035 [Rhodocyclaceae bacterium]|jgi:hypothetical protein|nr:hypothetical protein [Rhodocyclaceae bacterium]MCE2721805.1 hypothetical protein [Betaproteobacteria bacterium]MCA3025004.1 hypothetical protein [Rhodocyclaceae bacterium]MCA3027353.1 hypothetical protein [Rhodocyclaceae bacterium]MCA3036695.1 hypothetical protein [Rhodocyclaceae bacterium]
MAAVIKWMVVSLCLFFSALVPGQNPPAPSGGPTAKHILQMAVAASGGDTWQQPKTLMLKGDAVWTPYGKTDAAHQMKFDDYAMYRVFPTENDSARQASGKVRFDAKQGENVFMQLIFDSKVTHNFLSEQAKPYQKHFSWSNNFGFGILRFADRDGFQVDRLVDDQIEGELCYVVQITDPKKQVTTFFIDQQNKYIRSVAFTTDVGFHHRIYSDFKRAPNVDFVQPTRVRLYFDGIKWMDIFWRQFKVNEPIADSVFVR